MINNLIFPLDYIVISIGFIIILLCFWRGIISSILGLLTWIGSIIITIYFYIDLSNFIYSQLLNLKIFRDYEQITNLISVLISVPLIFLISLFILKKIRKIISSDIDKQILGVLIDKMFGFLFGFVFNYIVFSTLLYFTNNFDFLNFVNNWMVENSYLLYELENININLFNSFTSSEIEISN